MILYFSATGNTEFIAKRIANGLNDESLNLLKRIKNHDYSEIHSDKPFIICAPIYVCEIPNFLYKYLKNVKLTGTKQIYFILTSGGYSGIGKHYCKKIARKQKMKYMGTADFKMPRNYIASDAYPLLSCEENVQRLKDSINKIPSVIERIKEGKKIKSRYVWQFEYLIIKPFTPIWIKLKLKSDKFYSTNECIGCGKCAVVCPFNNIEIKDKKPVWGLTDCTHCMACVSNCPKEAIEYGEITKGKERFLCSKYKNDIE